jgi:putative inorganic carbon (hco3(-)) transporter
MIVSEHLTTPPNSDESARQAFTGSRCVEALQAVRLRLQRMGGRALSGSYLARHAQTLLLLAVCLLFLLSPWVGTAVNAGLTLLSGACLLLLWWARPDVPIRPHRLDLLVLAFAAAHFLSIGFSPFLVPSLKGAAKMMIFWLAYAGFRFATPGRQASLWIVGALVVTAGLQSSYGIYQWVIGVEPLANWEDPEALNPLTRVYGSLMNPNLLAGYLLAVFPLSCALAAILTGWVRFIPLYTACVAPVCVFFTYSRGAYLGIAASLGIFAVMAGMLLWPRVRHRRNVVASLLIAGTGALGVLAWKILGNPALVERLGSIFTLRGHSSNSFRMNVWTGVWQMIQDNWVLGVGVGNGAFRKMYSLYMVSGYEALGAYNIFLEVTAELGVIGLGIFLVLNAVALRINWLTFRHGDAAARWMSVAIMAALVGTWVMGLFDTVFYRPAVQLQFWLLLALTVAWAHVSPAASVENPPAPNPKPL